MIRESNGILGYNYSDISDRNIWTWYYNSNKQQLNLIGENAEDIGFILDLNFLCIPETEEGSIFLN